LGESVVRLQVQPDGTLLPTDFFCPFDADTLDNGDLDLGSCGPVALPDAYFGTPQVPHLLVQSGKSGNVYLLNRDHLGGFRQGVGGLDDVVQRLGPNGGVFGRFSAWPGDGGWLWVSEDATGSRLRAYKYAALPDGSPFLTAIATSPD